MTTYPKTSIISRYSKSVSKRFESDKGRVRKKKTKTKKKKIKTEPTKTPNTSQAWKTYSTWSPRDRRFPSRKQSGRRGRGCRSPCSIDTVFLVAVCTPEGILKTTGKIEQNLLVKPIPQHTPSRPQPTNLHAFGAPSLFAVEDGEGGPADLAFGGLADGASFRCQSQLTKTVT
jgi:hypothetical protein